MNGQPFNPKTLKDGVYPLDGYYVKVRNGRAVGLYGWRWPGELYIPPASILAALNGEEPHEVTIPPPLPPLMY